MKCRYIVITPARNEERTIEKTIQSMVNQEILPVKWIIIDDGSRDKTRSIVEKYLSAYEWIDLVQLEDRGFRQLGPGVVKAFNVGFEKVRDLEWDYVVKLDADLSFNRNYFSNMLKHFHQNPKLGIASGKTFLIKNGKQVIEWCHDDHVRGPIKMYSAECFSKIGGIAPLRGWDVIDEVTAQMGGYQTRSFFEERVIHHRPVDGRQRNVYRSRYEMGKLYYFLGYDPLYLLIRSVRSCVQDYPRGVGGLLLFVGYVVSTIKKDKQYDQAFVAQFRQKQRQRIRISHLLQYLRESKSR